MRRWTLVIAVALQAAVLITLSSPSGAMAASTSTFKGKASVYYRNSGPYFVINFKCSDGTLSGASNNWTYAVYEGNTKESYSGTLGSAACALKSDSPGWTSSFGSIPLNHSGSQTPVGSLTLVLSHISATKTYANDTSVNDTSGTGTCPKNSSSFPACIQITVTFSKPIPGSTDVLPTFDSRDAGPCGMSSCAPYGTLTMQLPS